MAISIRTEASVRASRIAEFEALQERLFNLCRNQPGYQGGALLCSQSHPLIYSRISVWDDVGAVKAFWKGDAFRDFVEHAPDDVSTFTRPMECYELIETVRDSGTPAVVAMAERTIRLGTLNDFVASRQELFKLQRSEGRGAVTSAVSRLAGSLTKTVAYLSYLSQDDLMAFINSAAYQGWAEKHGNAYDAEPPAIEVHQAVLVYAPVTA